VLFFSRSGHSGACCSSFGWYPTNGQIATITYKVTLILDDRQQLFPTIPCDNSIGVPNPPNPTLSSLDPARRTPNGRIRPHGPCNTRNPVHPRLMDAGTASAVLRRYPPFLTSPSPPQLCGELILSKDALPGSSPVSVLIGWRRGALLSRSEKPRRRFLSDAGNPNLRGNHRLGRPNARREDSNDRPASVTITLPKRDLPAQLALQTPAWRSRAVALLELLAAPAPAGVVAPDLVL
jgi:hypothetical protein